MLNCNFCSQGIAGNCEMDINKAKYYLQEIRKVRRRYIRDQLQLIMKHAKSHEQVLLDMALEECLNRHLFSATDFVDMVQYLNRQRLECVTDEVQHPNKNQLNQYWNDTIAQTKAQTRNIEEYVSVLEGDTR